MNTNKWALYCRVSTIDQHPEAQRAELERWARAKGLSFDVFEETESTRKTRPVKEAVKAALHRREYVGVAVWKLDRWGRSSGELNTELDDFAMRGVEFVSLRDNIDLGSASGRLFAHLLSAFAEFERDLIRERTLLGLAEAAKRGKHPGRPAGSKDTKPRRKAGYLLRYANKRS